MLPPLAFLFFFVAIKGSDGQDQMRFICPSNTELIAEVNGTLLKRMDDAESNLAAKMHQLFAKVENLEGTVAENRAAAMSVESANSAKFDDMQQKLLSRIEDSDNSALVELKNLANFIDSMKSEIASLSAKFARLETSFMDSLTSGFKDIAMKLESVKSTCQNQTNLPEGDSSPITQACDNCNKEICSLSSGTNLITLRNGKKYTFSDFALSWFSAKLLCEQRGLALATVKSNQDFSALSGAIGNKDVVFWLSASDTGRPRGQFVWLDGTPLSRRGPMWYRGQAVYYQQNHENCVFLYRSKLRDYDCSANIRFICELPPQCYK